MPTQQPLPLSSRNRLKAVVGTTLKTSTLVKQANLKCAWCSLGQKRALCPVCSCFEESHLSIKELEVDGSESATPTKEVFNLGKQKSSNDKELRQVANALAAEDNFDLDSDLGVDMNKTLQGIVADFSTQKISDEHPAGICKSPVAGSKQKLLEDFPTEVNSLPPLKVDFDVLDLIARPSSKSSFSTYGSLHSSKREKVQNKSSTVCDKESVDLVNTQWEVTMISPKAAMLSVEPNCVDTVQHVESADPIWEWEFTVPPTRGEAVAVAVEGAVDFGTFADQNSSIANPQNPDRILKTTHQLSKTDKVVTVAHEADENVHQVVSNLLQTKVPAAHQQTKTKTKFSKKRPLQQQTSWHQKVSGSIPRDPRRHGATTTAPLVKRRYAKRARKTATTRTDAHSSPTFRLGVHLVRFSQMGIAAVAQRLDIQPQEPRTLKRYSIGIPTSRRIRTNVVQGVTDYKLKLKNLQLNEKFVPAIALHFFPEGIQFADGQSLEAPDPKVELCPAPTRQVGETWSGSNGTYKCIRHAPCGCPGNAGAFAVIKKIANRRKKSRRKAGTSCEQAAPAAKKAPTAQARTSAI